MIENKFPKLTVDIIIEHTEGSIVLIERRNKPLGWALPGGFVDYGETLEHAARREAFEETSLKVKNLKQFKAYSDPSRDPRGHTVSVVFTASANGIPKAMDDAKGIGVFRNSNLPEDIVFDHKKILSDYFKSKRKARK